MAEKSTSGPRNTIFTKTFGGTRRKYYLDIKTDTRGGRYITLSEVMKDAEEGKRRNRVMIWPEDFEPFLEAVAEMDEFLTPQEMLSIQSPLPAKKD